MKLIDHLHHFLNSKWSSSHPPRIPQLHPPVRCAVVATCLKEGFVPPRAGSSHVDNLGCMAPITWIHTFCGRFPLFLFTLIFNHNPTQNSGGHWVFLVSLPTLWNEPSHPAIPMPQFCETGNFCRAIIRKLDGYQSQDLPTSAWMVTCKVSHHWFRSVHTLLVGWFDSKLKTTTSAISGRTIVQNRSSLDLSFQHLSHQTGTPLGVESVQFTWPTLWVQKHGPNTPYSINPNIGPTWGGACFTLFPPGSDVPSRVNHVGDPLHWKACDPLGRTPFR